MATEAKQATPEAKGIPEEEFEQACDQIEKIIADARKKIITEAAPILGRFNRRQLQIVKQRLRKMFGMKAEQVERLHMLGKGQIPAYLAEREKSVLPSLWRSMPQEIKQRFEDPCGAVKVLTPTGKKTLMARDLNAMQWNQILEPHKGIRSLADQRRFMLPLNEETPHKNGEADVFESLQVSDNGYVIVYGKPADGKGSRTSAIKIKLSQLRRLI